MYIKKIYTRFIPLILFTVLIAFFLSGSVFPAYSQNNEKAGWMTTASCNGKEPIKRHEAAFTRVGDRLYLLGGRGIRPVSIYDVNSKTWSTGSRPPIELHHFQPVVHQNKIYVVGAMTGGYPDEDPVSHIYIYDTQTDTWAKGDSIPSDRRRGSAGAVMYDGKIYLASGIVNGHISGHKPWFDVYNPETEEWKTLPSAPRARDHTQAVVIDHKLYLAGGRRSKAPDSTFNLTVPEVDIYDFKKGQWNTADASIPTERAGTMALEYKSQLVIIGGESGTQSDAHSEVEAFDPDSGIWHTLPSLVEGRHGTGAIQIGDNIVVASGSGSRGGSPELRSMEVYVPSKATAEPFITDSTACVEQ